MAEPDELPPTLQNENGRTMYQSSFMLALSKSPLVKVPDGMPALSQWYGEWEPYHFRSFPQQGNYAGKGHRGGADTNEVGTSRNRYKRGERSAQDQAAAGGTDYAGRNPFGQLSSSGAFRPAGRTDALATSTAPSMSYGRNGVMGKIGREISQKKSRGGLHHLNMEENDQEGFSSASRRSTATSDWRKTTQDGPGAEKKSSFPAWMADEAEPAWMGSPASGRQEHFDEHGDINVDDVDVSGMDEIQAFKVRMKEREKRAKQKELGITETVEDTPLSNDGGEVDGPVRTSRFARFFDGGKPAATGSQQAQEQVPPPRPAESDAGSSSAVSMADLFRSMGVNRQETVTATSPVRVSLAGSQNALSPPAKNNLASSLSGEADTQGMQKIMALLSSSGGSSSGATAPPPPPPGLHFGGSQQPQRPDFGASPIASPSSPHHIRRADPTESPSRQHQPVFAHQQQQQHHPLPPPPPPGWHGSQPLYGPPPPGFGLDVRMMGHHDSAEGNAMPHSQQNHQPPPPMHVGFPPLPPGMRAPPLPPQLQQHLIGLPPQVQHQIISQHFHHMAQSGRNGPAQPPHMPPPPPGFHMPNSSSHPPLPHHSPTLHSVSSQQSGNL